MFRPIGRGNLTRTRIHGYDVKNDKMEKKNDMILEYIEIRGH